MVSQTTLSPSFYGMSSYSTSVTNMQPCFSCSTGEAKTPIINSLRTNINYCKHENTQTPCNSFFKLILEHLGMFSIY